MPGWDSAPQAHSRVSNINFVILIFFLGDPINIPWKIVKGRQISFPRGAQIRGISRVFNLLKFLSGILHLKSTAGCQISNLIFEFLGGPYKYPMKNCQRTAKFFPTCGLDQRNCSGFNWLKCLMGLCTSSPLQGININFVIMNLLGSYFYPMKNCQRTAKFLPTWGLSQRYPLVLYLTKVPGWDSTPQVHSRMANINFDIWIWGDPIYIPRKNAKERNNSFPLGS